MRDPEGTTTSARPGPAPDANADRGAATADPAPPLPAGRVGRAWALLRFPVTAYLAAAAVLYALVAVSTRWLSRHEEYPIQVPLVFRGAGVLEGWVRFDGGWYREIALNGYSFTDVQHQAPVAFFPAYPLAMRWLGYATGDPLLAGIVLTFLSGLGVVILLHRWCDEQLGRPAADAAVVTLVVYPYVWYLFGAVYADALFVLFTLAAFVLVEHDHPVLAGLAAAVATAARPVGVGVIIGLVAVTLEHRGALQLGWADLVRSHGWRPSRWPAKGSGARPPVVALHLRRLRAGDLGILLAPLGLALWMAWLWRTYGDPLLFAHIEAAAGWDQSAGPHTWFKEPFWSGLTKLPELFANAVTHTASDVPHAWNGLVYTVGLAVQALFVLGGLALVPRILRRVGWGYAAYVVGVMLLPLIGSKDFQGTGRYLLAAFPVFAVAGDALAGATRPWVRWAVWGAGAVGLLLLTSAYARGYYVA